MWTYPSFTPLGKRKGNHCSMWSDLQHILVCSWYSVGCHLDQIHPQLKFLFSKQAYTFLKTCFLNIRMLERKAAFGEELGQEHGQLVCGTVERPAALPGVGGKQTGSWSWRHFNTGCVVCLSAVGMRGSPSESSVCEAVPSFSALSYATQWRWKTERVWALAHVSWKAWLHKSWTPPRCMLTGAERNL